MFFQEKPFTVLADDHENKVGNDKFEGMMKDLLNHIARERGFKYEMYLVPDGNFGSRKKDGEWNGMIGEVLKGVRI